MEALEREREEEEEAVVLITRKIKVRDYKTRLTFSASIAKGMATINLNVGSRT